MRRPVPIALAAALICGCATTPYQPLNGDAKAGEGFSETQLGPTIYEVKFLANGNTPREQAGDFALLRAAELCLLNGYRHFVVTGSWDMFTTAPRMDLRELETDSDANLFGISGTRTSSTSYRGAPRPKYAKPRPRMVVGFLASVDNTENLGRVYDAASLRDSIRARYAIVPLDTRP